MTIWYDSCKKRRGLMERNARSECGGGEGTPVRASQRIRVPPNQSKTNDDDISQDFCDSKVRESKVPGAFSTQKKMAHSFGSLFFIGHVTRATVLVRILAIPAQSMPPLTHQHPLNARLPLYTPLRSTSDPAPTSHRHTSACTSLHTRAAACSSRHWARGRYSFSRQRGTKACMPCKKQEAASENQRIDEVRPSLAALKHAGDAVLIYTRKQDRSTIHHMHAPARWRGSAV